MLYNFFISTFVKKKKINLNNCIIIIIYLNKYIGRKLKHFFFVFFVKVWNWNRTSDIFNCAQQSSKNLTNLQIYKI